ncbi:uncharacterized protein LOC116842705 [Odontomachus brunneus]|uniref:uncharacterized protein LOC116842705 n=1 Tax=Odontomachus brunneus TaxID=486640 RepID=UPI0013F1DD8D|nr:uncharacterized protein LOC116842705 [Odontomachus brunneus]
MDFFTEKRIVFATVIARRCAEEKSVKAIRRLCVATKQCHNCNLSLFRLLERSLGSFLRIVGITRQHGGGLKFEGRCVPGDVPTDVPARNARCSARLHKSGEGETRASAIIT